MAQDPRGLFFAFFAGWPPWKRGIEMTAVNIERAYIGTFFCEITLHTSTKKERASSNLIPPKFFHFFFSAPILFLCPVIALQFHGTRTWHFFPEVQHVCGKEEHLFWKKIFGINGIPNLHIANSKTQVRSMEYFNVHAELNSKNALKARKNTLI